MAHKTTPKCISVNVKIVFDSTIFTFTYVAIEKRRVYLFEIVIIGPLFTIKKTFVIYLVLSLSIISH